MALGAYAAESDCWHGLRTALANVKILLKNAEIGFKLTERGQNGPKEVKRGQMRTNGARPSVLIRQVRFLLIFHLFLKFFIAFSSCYQSKHAEP